MLGNADKILDPLSNEMSVIESICTGATTCLAEAETILESRCNSTMCSEGKKRKQAIDACQGQLQEVKKSRSLYPQVEILTENETRTDVVGLIGQVFDVIAIHYPPPSSAEQQVQDFAATMSTTSIVGLNRPGHEYATLQSNFDQCIADATQERNEDSSGSYPLVLSADLRIGQSILDVGNESSEVVENFFESVDGSIEQEESQQNGQSTTSNQFLASIVP